MDRRGFLKGAGLASVAGVAAVALSPARAPAFHWARLRELTVGDRVYRVDGSAHVYVSADDGATWQVHSRLAERFSIRAIGMGSEHRVAIDVSFAGRRRFRLYLADDRAAWLTA